MRFTLLALALALSACGVLPKNEQKQITNPALESCGRAPNVGDRFVGGCELRLVKPKNCELVDLSGGKSYDFEWAADGTSCTGPFTLLVGGNPFNIDVKFNLRTVSAPGFTATLTAANLPGLTTTDGTFEWDAADANASHPASRVIRIKF